MAESHNGCPAGLGQKCLGSGHDPGYGCRCGQSVLQRQNHDVVEHLAFFNGGYPCLIIHKKNFYDTVTFFHQLGGVIAPGNNPVNVLVGHFGHPLKRRPVGVARHRAVFPSIIVEGILRAAQVADFALPFYFVQLICFFFAQITHRLYSPSSFCFLAYSCRSSCLGTIRSSGPIYLIIERSIICTMGSFLEAPQARPFFIL